MSLPEKRTPEAEAGGPPRFLHRTTGAVRAAERLDYWRSLHPALRIEALNRDDRRRFDADLLHCQAPDGSAFGRTRSADIRTAFGRAAGDYALLSVALAGRAHLDGARGRDLTATPASGLVLIDSEAPIGTWTRGLTHAYVTLPKRLLGEAAPARLAGTDGFRLLPDRGVVRLLRRHLQMLATTAEGLTPEAARAAMTTATRLAVGVLLQDMPPAPETIRAGNLALYEAATTLIHSRVERPDLTSDSLARALGCSRAQLYRIFAEQDRTIGQAIRAARMARARALLVAPAGLPVKAVAHRSGYADPAAFTRAFRAETGSTPLDYRDAHLERTD